MAIHLPIARIPDPGAAPFTPIVWREAGTGCCGQRSIAPRPGHTDYSPGQPAYSIFAGRAVQPGSGTPAYGQLPLYRIGATKARLAVDQARLVVKQLSSNKGVATTGDLILINAAYACEAGGFFGSQCNVRTEWTITDAVGKQLIHEVTPPPGSGDEGFDSVPVAGPWISGQKSFSMPTTDVTVTFTLYKPTISLGVHAGDEVADSRSVTIQWAAPDQASLEDAKRKTGEAGDAVANALGQLQPFLPYLVVLGAGIAAIVIAGPQVQSWIRVANEPLRDAAKIAALQGGVT